MDVKIEFVNEFNLKSRVNHDCFNKTKAIKHSIYKHTVKLIKYFINLTVWQIYFMNIL